MKIGVLTIFFLVFISCKTVTDRETEKVQIVVDSAGLKIKVVEKRSENLNLTSFLENPIDLQEFKKKKNRDFVATGVVNRKNYYFQPNINDSIFYGYNYVTKKVESVQINEIIVFKYGANKHIYEDETEIIIELRVLDQDSDLGRANLIGLSKKDLESEFGTDYLTLDNGIVYSNKNRILIIELDNSIVKSFRFAKLNTGNIDHELIQQIME